MNYRIEFTKRSQKDYERIKKSPLAKKLKQLLRVLQQNPFEPPCEALSGELKGLYSRRINKKHRLVYKVEQEKVIVVSAWSHYESM